MSSRALDDPTLEQRRRMALSHVRQFGDPVLRTPAEEITVFDDMLRNQAERMAGLMHDARGVGLAANQIGQLMRIVIVQPDDEEEPFALCNPRIVKHSDETDIATEGCLSIGEIIVEVERPVAITVEARDVSGEPLELEAEGFAARVIQHEIDHLDGILILDRTTPEARKEALKILRGAA
jgi:peptide deformylase